MPGKQKNIREIIKQHNNELAADSITAGLSNQRFVSRAEFIRKIEQQLTGADVLDNKQLELIFKDLYQEIYINAELGSNLLISDKERVLTSIELCVFGNSNIHDKVWETAKKLPIIKVMLNTEEYIKLGHELAAIIKELRRQDLKLVNGDWWKIKGQAYKIIGDVAKVNYILMHATRLEFHEALFLSDLLPLSITDFEYLGEFPN